MSLDSIVAAMTAAFGALASDVDAARVAVAAVAPPPPGQPPRDPPHPAPFWGRGFKRFSPL